MKLSFRFQTALYCLERFNTIRKEIKHVTIKNPVIVIKIRRDVPPDDDFLKEVPREPRRINARIEPELFHAVPRGLAFATVPDLKGSAKSQKRS